ncbi:MAG: hypothetical protein ACJAU3_001841 [Zhongshania sp.]
MCEALDYALSAVALNSNATISAIAGSVPMLTCAAAPDAAINTTFAATGIPMLMALEFVMAFSFLFLKRGYLPVYTW